VEDGDVTVTTSLRARRPSRPILQGVLPIDRARIPSEVIAGATLAALAIPETMGYASMAQMPVITGLYTILIPVFLFALLGSSRHLVVGADSATAMTMAAGLAALGFVGGSSEWVAMAGLCALLVGVVLVLARVFRLGFLANFLSRSVLIGFLTGVGIQVAMTQLAGVLGVPKPSGGVVEQFVGSIEEIPDITSWATLAVSVGVWVIILGARRIDRRIPGALIAVLGMILISYLGLLPSSISLLGSVQGGLPPIGLPQDVINVDDIVAVMPTVLACFIIILAQSAATSRAYAIKYGDSFDENVDLVGLSAANIGAGLSGTWIVNGSPTKTQMVDGAGGKSQLAQTTCGVVVLVVLLFFTPALQYMPNAVLAAVVMLIGFELIDVKGMRGIARVRSGEFAVAALTAATVVFVGIEQAIILAIALSLVEHLYHAYRPKDTTIAVSPDGRLQPQLISSGSLVQARPGLVIYRFGAGLYYANTTRFTEEIVGILESVDELRWFCLSGAAMDDVDYSGAGAIEGILDEVKKRGATFVVCEMEPGVMDRPDRYGLRAEVDGVYDFVDDVIRAYDQRPDAVSTPGSGASPATGTSAAASGTNG
jgi:MFS superfamily sulfate permease-like transporter